MDASLSPQVHRRMVPPHQPDAVTVTGLSGRTFLQVDLDPGASASTGAGPATRTVSIVTGATSSALARIFVLLATLGLVPVATRSASSEQDSIGLQLSFANVAESRLDLLCRKLFQLTETISVDASEYRFIR